MDAVLGPFNAAVKLVLPGSGVAIRISGSGRSTVFDFAIVRDGLSYASTTSRAGDGAGRRRLPGRDARDHGSKARLLTCDARGAGQAQPGTGCSRRSPSSDSRRP